MTVTAPYRSELPVGRDGFPQLLRAEWTKFRTVRGWVIGAVCAGLVLVLLGFLTSSGSHRSCGGPNGPITCPTTPKGPGGEPITDEFYFVHQPLIGDGTVTVQVNSMTGEVVSDSGRAPVGSPSPGSPSLPVGTAAGVQPWAKAGLIVKASTTVGSAYAAIMVTGDHGVRMQDDFTHDTAGSAGTVSSGSPRWLRLTRSGASVTGYESTDGTHWTLVGTAQVAGLSSSVQAGLFVASPDYNQVSHHLGGSSGIGHTTLATATFDHASLQGGSPGASWIGGSIHQTLPAGFGPGPGETPGGFRQSAAGAMTVTGSGDIAPDPDGGDPVEHTLVGAFAALIVLIVLATMFMTGEYRRGLVRTTLAASPRRGRVLAAKAIVVAAVAFVTGLVSSAIAMPLGENILRHNGVELFPTSAATNVRVVAGTAALLAVAAVLAVAVGTILRRSATAITLVIVVIVAPYFLTIASVVPAGAAQWLLRLTPAAGFAIQQSKPLYHQVTFDYSPANGFFPLGPWAGFAVLCGYAAAAMVLAVYLLRRRDA
jgi:ABC-type transport system involved in multi-copper enzyme maturation permease subunit